MTTGNWGYALACVLVPGAWGLLIYGAAAYVQRWAARRHPRQPATGEDERGASSPEYHI